MRRRSLWPREHGAYFQLAIPLVTACALRAPALATLALAIGAALAFLANEPLLVVLGHRGERRRAIDGERARLRLAVLATSSAALGALGLVLSPTAAIAAAIVAVPVVVLLGFAWRRAEHTFAGECAAAIALTGAAMPVLVASGAPLDLALGVWGVWALGFGATVIAVHRVIARHRRRAAPIDYVLVPVLVATTMVAAIGWAPMQAAIPLVAIAAILVARPPPAARLRAIGVAIVAAAIASSAILLVR